LGQTQLRLRHAIKNARTSADLQAAVNHDGSRSYTEADIDFFAFYIIPEDIWYIVPIAELTRARYAVYLNPHEPGNKYFRFMEAWHLLRAPQRMQPARTAVAQTTA
jgi:hypothetical protein